MENKTRLIDANALFEFLKEQRKKQTGAYSKGRNSGINIAISAIRNEEICPTVDAEEVVRCKDCKKSQKWKNAFGAEGLKCYLLCADIDPDDFCSYGERKDNGKSTSAE